MRLSSDGATSACFIFLSARVRSSTGVARLFAVEFTVAAWPGPGAGTTIVLECAPIIFKSGSASPRGEAVLPIANGTPVLAAGGSTSLGLALCRPSELPDDNPAAVETSTADDCVAALRFGCASDCPKKAYLLDTNGKQRGPTANPD